MGSSYENPQVPHEVNVVRERPLAEFLRLAAGLALFIGLLSVLLYFAGGWLARYVPFSTEISWVGDRVLGIDLTAPSESGRRAEHMRIEAYLRRLTADLAGRMDLPAGMRVRAHFTQTAVPNAFATLGGHVVVTSALYARMPSENALAMVVAHEIAHVRERDPISALGGAATLGVLLALASGEADGFAPYLAQIVQRGYSRRAEARADALAVAALRGRYGHAGGAAEVFEVLSSAQQGALSGAVPPFLSTHPADADRIAGLRAKAAGWDPRRQPLVALEVPVSAQGAK